MARRLIAAWPVAVACAGGALLATAFLYGTPPDEEEFRYAVLSAWLRARAVASGTYPFWSSELGFGLPQPFIPHFGLHPFVPLLPAMSPVLWMRLVLALHTFLGAIGMWLLCRSLELAGAVGAVCVVTYLLAAPVLNYLLSDFWPSHYMVWTALPLILLLTWRIVGGSQGRPWRYGVALGLVVGLTIANANPSYAAVYAALPIAIIVTCGRTMRWRQWAALGLALVISAAIAAPTVVHLIVERRLFAHGLSLSNVTEPLPFSRALDSVSPPFGTMKDTRTLFVGAPFTLLALVGCVWFARTRTDLVLAAGIAALMLFTTWVPVPIISQRYQFRDPLTICAIVLAGCIADRWWRRTRVRPAVAIVLLIQTAVVVATAWPYIERTWEPDGLRASVFRGATADTPLADGLVAAMRVRGRLAYSPRVDHAVLERALVEDGLGPNALAYRGVPVVNGLFKAVATDALWPNDRLFYGPIRLPQTLVESDASLDVLAIRYLLAYRDERVAPGLRQIWSGRTIRGADLVLFENPDAYHGAFLVDPSVIGLELPLFPGCSHDRLLCRDVGTLARFRDREVATIAHGVNEIDLTWAPAAEPRLLIVTEMYRPAWIAASGIESLHTRPVQGGFLGVLLPAGVSSLHLQYRPRSIIAASFVCYGALALSLVVLAVTAQRPAASSRRLWRSAASVPPYRGQKEEYADERRS